MIENSDRGITLNKTLAWTMLVTLASAVFWSGSTVQGLVGSVNTLTETVEELKSERQAVDGRIRLLETAQARADERFTNILALLSRIDQRLERIEQYEGKVK